MPINSYWQQMEKRNFMTKSQPQKKKTGQTVAVISVSVFAVVSLIIAGIFIGGGFTWEAIGLGGENAGYRNITLTDAQFACEKEARAEYGDRLVTVTIDALSSRYDEKNNRFRMYFNLDMYPRRGKDKNIPLNYFLNCFVHGSRGHVTHFESVENKEEDPKPIRKTEGNVFGF